MQFLLVHLFEFYVWCNGEVLCFIFEDCSSKPRGGWSCVIGGWSMRHSRDAYEIFRILKNNAKVLSILF